MRNNGHNSPGVLTMTSRIARTGLGLLRNRGELLAVEWQQERARLTEILVWIAGLIFFVEMFAVLLSVAALMAIPGEWRLLGAAGLCVVYGAVGFVFWLKVRAKLRQEPFTGSIEQLRKDAQCLD